MTIAELKNHRISPFEIDDPQMLKLFSFFLHQAPTIESSSAANIDEVRLEKNWNDFIGELSLDKYCFIHPNSKKVESYLADYCLDPQSVFVK